MVTPWTNPFCTIHISLRDIYRKHSIEYHSYADNQQEYLSFAPTIEGDKEICLPNFKIT